MSAPTVQPLPHVEVTAAAAAWDALVAERGHPTPGRRPWTEHEIKRACGRCGFEVGDHTPAEVRIIVLGLVLPDVAAECLVCSPLPAPPGARS